MSSKSLSMAVLDQRAIVANRESNWRQLYKLGGGAAFISLLVIPITIVVYFVWPPPETVTGHFAAFQSNWLVGFLGMDLLYLPIIGIYVSIFSVLIYWIWYFLIARRLWQLGRA